MECQVIPQVCVECGVKAGQSASGRNVHLDQIPEGYALHDAEVLVAHEAKQSAEDERAALRLGLSDLLRHHDAICPPRTCAFAKDARRLLVRPT